MKKFFITDYNQDMDKLENTVVNGIDPIELVDTFRYYCKPMDKFIKLFDCSLQSEYTDISITKKYIDKETLIIKVSLSHWNCERDIIRSKETIAVRYKKSYGYFPRTMKYTFEDC